MIVKENHAITENVTLGMYDKIVESDVITINVISPINNPPNVTFSASNITVNAGDTVTFNYTVSDPENDPLYCWLDLDGNGNYEQTDNGCNNSPVTYKYNNTGTYTATLKVSDGTNTVIKTVTVTVTATTSNNPPVINSFTVNPNSGPAPLNASFSWSVSDADGDILTCYLDVNNDGSDDYVVNDCANNNSQSHTYNNTGTYVATLKVSDGTNTVVKTVTVTVTSISGLSGQWIKTYGGSGWDFAYSIQQTSDGGYIVVGYTDSFGAGLGGIWVLKLDSNGNIQWQKTYGGSGWDFAYSIQQTSDGGYIVAGPTDSFGAGQVDVWVLKLDSNGNIQWQKTYGGSGWDFAYSIQQTSDGGYVVVSYRDYLGSGQSRVLKLDSNGNVQWQKTYGGSGNSGRDHALSIQQTSDGGYIMTGYTNAFGIGGYDIWILKLDANGNIANCTAVGSSSAVVQDTSATVSSTSVIPSDSNVTPTSSNATVTDTNVAPTEVCIP